MKIKFAKEIEAKEEKLEPSTYSFSWIELNSPFDDFVIACHQGNANKVEAYLKTADYVSNSFDFFGWTPLHAACAGLNFYIIKLLLEHDEDPVTVDKRGNSTFQLMIKWNRIMKDLVADYRVTFRLMMKEAKHKYGNDIVNKVYENGETTLHTAVIKGEETSVEILLSLGADMFVKSHSGETALEIAKRLSYDDPEKFFKIHQILKKQSYRSNSLETMGNDYTEFNKPKKTIRRTSSICPATMSTFTRINE